MDVRKRILSEISKQILALQSNEVILVAIDGVDGAGKTFLADELVAYLMVSDRPIIRSSVDGFHNPREIRYRLGKASPLGFFQDSYNYNELIDNLLRPLSPGGDKKYRKAIFDHRTNLKVEVAEAIAAPGSILIFDGIFLHRPELRDYWDFSIFLEVDFTISIPRVAQRGEGSPDPKAETNKRYIEGQKLYLSQCHPQKFASIVVNNNDLNQPYFVNLDGG
jgi:uridine kinase